MREKAFNVLIGVLATAAMFAVALGFDWVADHLKTTDEERIDKIEIHGEECMVVRNGLGRVKAIDCNWEAS